MAPVIGIISLVVGVAGLALAVVLRKLAYAGRRLRTPAELEAAYKKISHGTPNLWAYPPYALRLLRVSGACFVIALLAVLSAMRSCTSTICYVIAFSELVGVWGFLRWSVKRDA